MRNLISHILILTLAAVLGVNSQLIILSKTVSEWLSICQHSDIKTSHEEFISSDQVCQRVKCLKGGETYGIEFQQCQIVDENQKVCTAKFASFPSCCKEKLCLEPDDNLTKTTTAGTKSSDYHDYGYETETVGFNDVTLQTTNPASSNKSMDVHEETGNTTLTTPPPKNQQTAEDANSDFVVDDDQDVMDTSDSSTAPLDLPVSTTEQTKSEKAHKQTSTPPPTDSKKSEEQQDEPSSESEFDLGSDETLTTIEKATTKPTSHLKKVQKKTTKQKRLESIKVTSQSNDINNLKLDYTLPEIKTQTIPVTPSTARRISRTDSSEEWDSLFENVQFRKNSVMITEQKSLKPMKHHHHHEVEPDKATRRTNRAHHGQKAHKNYVEKCQVDFSRCLSLFLVNVADDSSEYIQKKTKQKPQHFGFGKTKHHKSHRKGKGHQGPTVTWSDLYNEKAFRSVQKEDEVNKHKSYIKHVKDNSFAELDDDFPELEKEMPFSQLPHKNVEGKSNRRHNNLEDPQELTAAEYNF